MSWLIIAVLIHFAIAGSTTLPRDWRWLTRKEINDD